MKKHLIAATIFFVSVAASAGCVGTGTFRTCTDNSGNTYNVQSFGNTTYTQGSNPSTGSNWNQTSNTYGNTTYHNGTAANGNNWNGTSTTYGNTTYHQGTDSRGNAYNKVCNQFGCN